MKSVVGACPCAISLDHLDFRFFMLGSYSQNQDEVTLSFISRWKSTFLYFEEDVRIRSLCNSLDHLDCSHGVQAVFYSTFFISVSKLFSSEQ